MDNLNSAPTTDDAGLSRFAAATAPTKTPVLESRSTDNTPASKIAAANRPRRKFLPKTWHKIVFGLLLLFILVLAAVGSYTFVVGRQMLSELRRVQTLAAESKAIVASQNFPALQEKIQAFSSSKNALAVDYAKLSFYRYVPIINRYYQDGETALAAADHALVAAEEGVNAILPYAGLLGLQGEGSFTGGTTQERVVLILDTLEKIQPSIDKIDQEVQSAADLVASIDSSKYPTQVAGRSVRPQLQDLQASLTLASQTFSDYKPVLAQLGKMAGAHEPQKYLVLFQNDNELRPTGGFLTAYAIINVDKGVVTSEKSDDIYELDQKFTKRIPIPAELGRYLTTERYFHLRDMNISPDFKTSMDTFYQYYKDVPGEPDDIDGIVALDTEVLTKLLEVIGPVEVPGYGTFSAANDARCDCPQVVYALSEIITKPTPYLREDRKGVLGPLMKSILAKTYDLDKAQFPQLLTVALESIKGRHAQAYFMEEQSQQAAEQINLAGRIYQIMTNNKNWQLGQNMDFMAIIDANLGGAKSNLFTNYEVKQIVQAPLDGRLEKTVEITYKNDRRADNCNLEAGQLCLNSTLVDWFRLYVPAGAELIEAQGFTQEAKVYEEAGLTVIDGYFEVEPLGLAKIKLSYSIPYTDTITYNLRLWKQGGINSVPVLMDVTGGEEELVLDGDQDYSTVF